MASDSYLNLPNDTKNPGHDRIVGGYYVFVECFGEEADKSG